MSLLNAEYDTLFVQVILPVPLAKLYTYRVPIEWHELILLGQRVAVQFGPKKIYAAIVVGIQETPPVGYTASYILEVLDDVPVVSIQQLQFWKWIANYYMCYLGDVMNIALPGGYKLQSESKLRLSSSFNEEEELDLDEKEWLIVNELLQKKELQIEAAAKLLGIKSAHKYIKSLYNRNLIVIQEEFQDKYQPKYEIYISLTEDWKSPEFANAQLDLLEKKSIKQADVILALLGNTAREMQQSALTQKHGIGNAAITALLKKKLILKEKKAVDRISFIKNEFKDYELNESQKKAVHEIHKQFILNKPVLIHGVTGSGKTFVYLNCIEKKILEGKQVLFLIPEVALTEHLVQRLQQYFQDKLGVWHHYYSANEKTEIYEKVRNNQIKVLLGTRSAIFAPFANLGLVVIDEEHESSYKQFEKRPHFNARDSAMVLASYSKANVLLGSATPSIEMLHLAEVGKIIKILLPKKYKSIPFSRVELVHMAEAKRQKKVQNIFSDFLLKSIEESLRNRLQVIVYQNRKGYVPYINCDNCGYTPHCINCDITLTYYKTANHLRCNYCNYHQEIVQTCPNCGSNALSMKGFGTERIAEELGIYFPEAKIGRFDLDVLKKRSDFIQVLQKFENRETDILVGTQLLAKGLDFSHVGLVVVVDADQLINLPDFRAGERAFQQLMQLSGRAGLENMQGKMLIQTHLSHHLVFEWLEERNTEAMYKWEVSQRKLMMYPPFYRLILITVKNKDGFILQKAAAEFAKRLQLSLGNRLLGPTVPHVGRIRNYYIQQILIKIHKEKDQLQEIKEYILQEYLLFAKENSFKGTLLDFDVDPM